MVLYSVCAFGMCFSLLGFLLLFVVTETQSEFDEIWIILPSIKFVVRAGVVTVAEASGFWSYQADQAHKDFPCNFSNTVVLFFVFLWICLVGFGFCSTGTEHRASHGLATPLSRTPSPSPPINFFFKFYFWFLRQGFWQWPAGPPASTSLVAGFT